MSLTPYTRLVDFTDEENAGVGGRAAIRSAGLDAELDAIKTTLDQVKTLLDLIQRDDGALTSRVLLGHEFSADALAYLRATIGSGGAGGSLIWRGDWLTATLYLLNDLVHYGGTTYICVTDHTSGVFATDLAAGKFALFAASGTVAGLPSPVGNANKVLRVDAAGASFELLDFGFEGKEYVSNAILITGPTATCYVPGDQTAFIKQGMPIRAVPSVSAPNDGYVSSVTYSAPNTQIQVSGGAFYLNDVVTLTLGSIRREMLPAGLSGIDVAIADNYVPMFKASTGKYEAQLLPAYKNIATNSMIGAAFPGSFGAHGKGHFIQLINTDGVNGTINMALAATAGTQTMITFVKANAEAFTLTIQRAGSDKISGANNTALLAQWNYVTLLSDGVSNWIIVAKG